MVDFDQLTLAVPSGDSKEGNLAAAGAPETRLELGQATIAFQWRDLWNQTYIPSLVRLRTLDLHLEERASDDREEDSFQAGPTFEIILGFLDQSKIRTRFLIEQARLSWDAASGAEEKPARLGETTEITATHLAFEKRDAQTAL